MDEKKPGLQEEQNLLLALVEREDVLEKKVKIYSRLLTDPALAKTMEELSARHEKRKEELLSLALGKPIKKKNAQGRCEMSEVEKEK